MTVSNRIHPLQKTEIPLISFWYTSLWYKGTMNRNSTPKCDFIHEQGLSKITIPNRFVTEENKDFQWVYGAGTSDGLGIQKQKFGIV